MSGTIWALVPPIVAIALALWTKEVYLSLLIGILSGALLCRHPDHDRSHELENRRQREYSALPGIPWNHRSPDYKIRSFPSLRRLGIQKNQIPERSTVFNHASRCGYLCRRLFQLSDCRNRYAPGHRQIQSKPRKTGLHHRRHSSTGLYHRTDLKLGGSRRILPAG